MLKNFRKIIVKVYNILDWFKEHRMELSVGGLNFYIKELFKRPAKEELEDYNAKPQVLDVPDDDGSVLDPDPSRNSLLKVFDYTIYPDAKIVNDDKVLGLIIVDDSSMTEYLYDSDFRKIKREKDKDVLEHFKIYKCFTHECGFTAYKHLLDPKNNIVYGIIDITLGHTIKHDSGLYLEIDGIDIAIKMLKNNPDAKFIFISAHNINRGNPVISKYISKFKEITGKELSDYYVNKSDTGTIPRYQAIYNLLYGDVDGKH